MADPAAVVESNGYVFLCDLYEAPFIYKKIMVRHKNLHCPAIRKKIEWIAIESVARSVFFLPGWQSFYMIMEFSSFSNCFSKIILS